MNWFNNLKIGKKLLIGYSIPSLIILFVGYFGLEVFRAHSQLFGSLVWFINFTASCLLSDFVCHYF